MQSTMTVRGNAASSEEVRWPPPDGGGTVIVLTRNDAMGDFDETKPGGPKPRRRVPGFAESVSRNPVSIGTAA